MCLNPKFSILDRCITVLPNHIPSNILHFITSWCAVGTFSTSLWRLFLNIPTAFDTSCEDVVLSVLPIEVDKSVKVCMKMCRKCMYYIYIFVCNFFYYIHVCKQFPIKEFTLLSPMHTFLFAHFINTTFFSVLFDWRTASGIRKKCKFRRITVFGLVHLVQEVHFSTLKCEMD